MTKAPFSKSGPGFVKFMQRLVEPNKLRTRVLAWAEGEVQEDRLPKNSGLVLEAVLYRGEMPRGEVARLLGTTDRQGRRVTSSLIERGVLVSDGPKAPLKLAFPAALASHWMPGLFPEQAGA